MIIEGDCLEVMQGMESDTFDSVITDPPYGLGFMGKEWDKGVPGCTFWGEMLRVSKPGAILLAFGGTRTWHRMATAIENAGWEIRDCIMWLYGSGFPKSMDISLAIDKAAGVEREPVGEIPDRWTQAGGTYNFSTDRPQSTVTVRGGPASPLAKQWDGWGTALKPAWEPIVVAMAPLDGTFANNAERYGVAGFNIDGARIEGEPWSRSTPTQHDIRGGSFHAASSPRTRVIGPQAGDPAGRFPANLILDEESAKDLGKPSRFFYCAKAGRAERDAGLESLELREGGGMRGTADSSLLTGAGNARNNKRRNIHPTVKPLSLMEYLCRLTSTPTGGKVLDPFCGSGTTGIACVNTGREFVGIEMNPEYAVIAKARIEAARLKRAAA